MTRAASLTADTPLRPLSICAPSREGDCSSGGHNQEAAVSADKRCVRAKVDLPRPDGLWHTPDGEAWATIKGWHYPVNSDKFRRWLAGRLYERDGSVPTKYELDALVGTYAADAEFRCPEHRVWLRYAQHGASIWLDLADKDGRVIQINKDGWRVVDARYVPVRFYRPSHMRPLPEPIREEADVWLLEQLVNIRNEDTLRLMLTWLSFAILPDHPYHCWR
jgi:hypothetical protein